MMPYPCNALIAATDAFARVRDGFWHEIARFSDSAFHFGAALTGGAQRISGESPVMRWRMILSGGLSGGLRGGLRGGLSGGLRVAAPAPLIGLALVAALAGAPIRPAAAAAGGMQDAGQAAGQASGQAGTGAGGAAPGAGTGTNPGPGASPGLATAVADTAAPYADIADLAEPAELVLELKIRTVAPLEAARAPNLRPGWARLYIEADTLAVLRGPQMMAPRLRYLVDVPLDAGGRLPELGRHLVMVFARAVAGHPADIQLVAPDGQLPWSPETEARTRGILAELAAPDAPGPVTAVSQAMFVAGTLAGQGETQIFLATKAGTPAAITVTHTPGQPPHWGVSFSEVVDTGVAGQPPAPGTLPWYRLACFLPDTLPAEANVSESPDDRVQAQRDYLLVRTELGGCHRLRQ